jgi:hypothetical protein
MGFFIFLALSSLVEFYRYHFITFYGSIFFLPIFSLSFLVTLSFALGYFYFSCQNLLSSFAMFTFSCDPFSC